jgi:hypothetical protein
VSHVVYRAYGDDASLLYVGMTGRGMARFQQHAHRVEWWAECVRIDVRHFPTFEIAVAAEKWAIQSEHPRFNVRPRASVVEAIVTDDGALVPRALWDEENYRTVVRALGKSALAYWYAKEAEIKFGAAKRGKETVA